MMHLSNLQGRVWDMNEAQGKHDVLRQPPDERLMALAGLGDVLLAVHAVTQQVLRHGVARETLPDVVKPILALRDTLTAWHCHVAAADWPLSTATLPRASLVLLATSTIAALAVPDDDGPLAAALAEVLLFIADLAEERHISLTTAVMKALCRAAEESKP